MSIALSTGMAGPIASMLRDSKNYAKYLPALGFAAASLGQIGAGIGAYRSTQLVAKAQEAAGRRAAGLERRRMRKIQGEQVAAFGKAGVVPSMGTPLAVLTESAATAEMNALAEQFRFDAAASIERAKGGMELGQSILGSLGSLQKASQAVPRKRRGT